MTSSMELAPALSVAELFDAHATRAAFQRLVDVINSQAAHVRALEARLAAVEATHAAAVHAQQRSVQQLDVVVAQLERQQDEAARVCEALTDQHSSLEGLASDVRQLRATASETQQQLDRHERATDLAVQQLRKSETATTAIANRLRDELDALHARATALDHRVDCKLDKAELPRLEGVVAQIHAFAPTADELTARAAALEADAASTQRSLQQLATQAADSAARLVELQRSMETMSRRQSDHQLFCDSLVVPQLERHAADAQALGRTANQLVERAVSLESSHRALASKLTSVSTALSDALQRERLEWESALAAKAAQDDLSQLQRDLATKAPQTDVERLAARLSTHLTAFAQTERHVQVATRAVSSSGSSSVAVRKPRAVPA
ncbi:hypothetical protein P43SY_010087 [Pythium insidiosum]|uniref:Uncharacterized protein n=1 Tax=Pythium insidiosum TaxID=114742 RepID=A0AAD5QBB9_PYTIN|nr:hypothetical protein P43SY_010087 [Pythium insidiosum]